MTRHTRNKQLRDLNKEIYENYGINMKMPTSIMFEKGAGTLDKDFMWLRNPKYFVTPERWKKKRYKQKDRPKIYDGVVNVILFGKNSLIKVK